MVPQTSQPPCSQLSNEPLAQVLGNSHAAPPAVDGPDGAGSDGADGPGAADGGDAEHWGAPSTTVTFFAAAGKGPGALGPEHWDAAYSPLRTGRLTRVGTAYDGRVVWVAAGEYGKIFPG